MCIYMFIYTYTNTHNYNFWNTFITASSDGRLFEGTKVLTWGCFEHLGIGQDNAPRPQDSWVQFWKFPVKISTRIGLLEGEGEK